jgi:hypothetical protein
MTLGVSAPFWIAQGSAHAEDFSNPGVNAYWGESWTDASGNYNSPDQTKNSVSGGQLSAVIPTDAVQSSPDNEVTNFIRTRADLPGASTYYNGSLLGDLSSAPGLTATLNVTNSTLTTGTPFNVSEFVGEGTTDPNTPSPTLRLNFTGGTGDVDANGNGDIEPNIWWSQASVDVTTLNNGQDVTLTADFDPSVWTNYDGLSGTNPLVAGQFQAALSDVTLLGISFGSGYFASDGWAFNTGGTASLNLQGINVPEPASFSLVGLGALGLLRRRRRTS